MILTNKYGYDEPIYQFLKATQYPPTPDRFSATDIIGPPYIRHLKLTKWDKIEEDVSNLTWAFFGSGCHRLLEDFAKEASFCDAEAKFTMKYRDKYTIVCKVDLYRHDTKEIIDYKFTKSYSIVFGVPDWEKQLNVNAYILWNNERIVNKLTSTIFLKDWNFRNTFGNDDYPKSDVIHKNVELWPLDKQIEYVDSRMQAHLVEDVPPCTNEERWRKKSVFAVMKKGGKRAVKLHDLKEDAEKMVKAKGKDYEVQFRAGEDTRCLMYCPVRSVCDIKV